MPIVFLLASGLLAGPTAQAGALSEAFVPTEAANPSDEHVRLVFLGDSGYVPDGSSCAWKADGSAMDSCFITVGERGRLLAAVRAAEPDAVYGLGDLVYPHAPSCQVPEGRDMQTLVNTVGAVYGGLGVPSYLVLGNHDVGHLESRDSRVTCLQAFVETVPDILLPAAQYSVDHGLVTVVVANSNLRDQELWPGAQLQEAVAGGDWVIFAAHHELHTAFEKMDEGIWEPPGSGEWLASLGVAPHLYTNGHAHTLQLGAFDARVVDDGEVDEDDPAEALEVLALTSGGGSKLRDSPTCTPEGQDPCDVDDARGQPSFAMARFGFGVVDITPERMTVEVRDLDGELLTTWARTRESVGPAPVEPVVLAEEDAGPVAAPLPGPRWCEASALGRVSLDGEEVVLVGDNEHKEGLLAADLALRGDLVATGALPYVRVSDKGNVRTWSVKDLEAITAWRDGLLVVGSHSRKGLKERDGVLACPLDAERRRASLVTFDAELPGALLGNRWERDDDADWRAAMASTEACTKALFKDLSASTRPDAEALCAVLVEADALAEQADPAGCENSLNIEGALTVGDRVWLGLRAPLVDGRAVLLRLESGWEESKRSRGLSFDAVATVDLGGLAIRGLDATDDRLVGSAHMVGDDPEGRPFTLWTAPVAELAPGARLPATLAGELPTSAEGVLVVGDEVLVVTDGDEGLGPSCAVESGSYRVPLPSSER